MNINTVLLIIIGFYIFSLFLKNKFIGNKHNLKSYERELFEVNYNKISKRISAEESDRFMTIFENKLQQTNKWFKFANYSLTIYTVSFYASLFIISLIFLNSENKSTIDLIKNLELLILKYILLANIYLSIFSTILTIICHYKSTILSKNISGILQLTQKMYGLSKDKAFNKAWSESMDE
jgi:hypothetical protein